jgi:hypothetical protein
MVVRANRTCESGDTCWAQGVLAESGEAQRIHDGISIVAQVVIGHSCRSFVFVIMIQIR